MSAEITEAFKREFDNTFRMVYQDAAFELDGAVLHETQQAEFKSWDFLGATSGVWDRASNSQTVHVNTPHSRRGNKQRPWTWSDLTDDIDKIQALVDPTSAYIQNMVAAANRAKTERILERLGATVLTGKDLTTVVNLYDLGESRVMQGDGTWASAGATPANTTATTITLAKIADVGLMMDNAYIPKTDRHLALPVDNLWVMLGLTKVSSMDFNTQKVLTTGTLDNFMGFKFHFLPTDRFETDVVETDCKRTYAWHKNAVLMTTGKDLTTKVDTLPTYNYSTQIFAEMYMGALRMQGPGVVQIKLLTSPTLTYT
jgi:hypothetical protein